MRSEVAGSGCFCAHRIMNDRMWTATVIRLFALIKGLLDVISLVTSGAASTEPQTARPRLTGGGTRTLELRVPPAAADDQHGAEADGQLGGVAGDQDVPRAREAAAGGDGLPKRTPHPLGEDARQR